MCSKYLLQCQAWVLWLFLTICYYKQWLRAHYIPRTKFTYMSIHFYERLQAGGAQKRCAYYKEIDDGDIISTSALGSDLICTMLMLAVTAYNILICE